MVFFKKIFGQTIKEIRTSEVERIQSDVINEVDALVKNVRKYRFLAKTKKELPEVKMSDEVKRLISAGFTQHKLVAEYNKLVENLHCKMEEEDKQLEELKKSESNLRFVIAARNIYGNGTLFMPLDRFVWLCNKYNLKCDTFDCYRGDIPDDKLDYAISLKYSGEQIYGIVAIRRVKKVINPYITLGDKEEAELKKRFERFPFVKKADGFMHTDVEHVDGTRKRYHYVELEVSPETTLFIAARNGGPIDVLNPRHHSETASEPLFCSLTEKGVLIFTRWDVDANYHIMNRLDELDLNIKALRL